MSDFSKPIVKKDSDALLSGKPVYTDDLAPSDCLIVKVLRSPHPYARVLNVDFSKAYMVDGIEICLWEKDMPKTRFCNAGQTFPKPSPNDRRILDNFVRYVGDPVAIIAGTGSKAVDKALKMVKVEYEVLDPILHMEDALDNKILVHQESDWNYAIDMGGDVKRNLIAGGVKEHGDLKKAMEKSDIIVEQTYETKANSQAMLETFRAYTYMDANDRLNCVSSTQVPFHVRRTLATALEIPMKDVRVVKPRIGGGFGAKQTVVMEMYPAIVTYITKKPAKMIMSRHESLIAGSARHPMKVTVKVGATKDGVLKFIDMYALSNTGAYGEHGSTTIGLTGGKAIAMYSAQESYRFTYDVVYTNTMANGAYRGYGATQGIFALESVIDELCDKLNMDPMEFRLKNCTKEGDRLHSLAEPNDSCCLQDMLKTAREKIGYDEIYPKKVLENGDIVSVGVAMSLQGSGIASVDTASARIALEGGGFYSLMIGSSDMGTGSDTTLAQIASKVLNTSSKNITVHGVDTDVSPFDPGSYASSTAYTTGNAVKIASEKLFEMMKQRAKEFFERKREKEINIENIDFDGEKFIYDNNSFSLKDMGDTSYAAGGVRLEAEASWGGKYSPPPFMVGAVKIKISKKTGKIEIIDFVGQTDPGTVINPLLTRVQTEGGVMQGIGMVLYEDTMVNRFGKQSGSSFLQYKIPTRFAAPNLNISMQSSYEPTGPYGVKSIGEVVINSSAPAIANAVKNAIGHRFTTLPIDQEDVWRVMNNMSVRER